ncbi:MAG: phosphatidylglycerophosphatase A [Gammaproteobacteria bacterium]|nr:phosphatidylglycerophosphatase A [Gammaproteobacteria bacterium]MCP5137880.1 phosphatidylglycerophosphatase A [Gammaproteobacteria bacterium]
MRDKHRPIPPRTVFSDPVHFFAFGFGSGLGPKAPGTFGSAAAILPFLWMQTLSPTAYLAVLAVGTVFGIWVCGESARRLGVHDHSGIVWDEFVGIWITLFLAPAGWLWIVIGFALFRVFDVLKPWPIRWLDRHVEGGLGIMLDDVLAGVFAWLVLQALVAGLP